MALQREISLTLPDWLADFTIPEKTVLADIQSRMRLVIELSRQNVLHGSGGPFAAAVFAQSSGTLVAIGVNRVEPINCSCAHAEVMAIAFAQQALQTYDLGAANLSYELVTSAQPCAMCLGAIVWSGVRSLVAGASRSDVQGVLGFDEGPAPRRWQHELRLRGITVRAQVLRRAARSVLELYRDRSGTVYNGRGCVSKEQHDNK